MSNRQSSQTSGKATLGKRIGRWSRGLCLLLAVTLGLQGALAHAQTVYYHNDVAGSPIAATDEAGNLLWRESYRPYGERMLRPAAANTQWFHGKQLDPDTWIEDFGARNYDPVLGRFLSIDPVDFSDKNIHSFNRYAYGNNNPVKYKDPDGRIGFLAIFLPLFGFGITAIGLGDEVSMPGGGLAKAGGKALGGAANAAAKVEGAAAQSAAKEAGSIRGVNAIGGKMNCVNCAIAADATLAGRPASALGGGPFRIDVLEKTVGGRFGAPGSISSVSEALSTAGPGARGIVFGSRGSGEVGHVFNVVNQNGVVRFLDGQTGRAASLEGFENFQLLRTN